jgi:hypothetical protein
MFEAAKIKCREFVSERVSSITSSTSNEYPALTFTSEEAAGLLALPHSNQSNEKLKT